MAIDMTPPVPIGRYFTHINLFSVILFECGPFRHQFEPKDGIKQVHWRVIISGVAAIEWLDIGGERGTKNAEQWLRYGAK